MAGSSHGHTPAAWTGVTIAFIGFCVAGAFMVMAPPAGFWGGRAGAPGPPLTRAGALQGTMQGVNADTQRAPRLSGLAVPGGILAAVAGAFAYVGTVDPNQPGHYPVCPLYQITGLYCPGCGGLRSAHAFIHGDFLAAIQDNAMAVVGYLRFAV